MTYLTNREAALHLCNGGKLEYMTGDGMWGYSIEPMLLLSPENIDLPSVYRAAVETFHITVRGVTFDVPEPVRTPLEVGTAYWIADPTVWKWCGVGEWTGHASDVRLLENGLIHLTEAAAVTHAKAMCGVA